MVLTFGNIAIFPDPIQWLLSVCQPGLNRIQTETPTLLADQRLFRQRPLSSQS